MENTSTDGSNNYRDSLGADGTPGAVSEPIHDAPAEISFNVDGAIVPVTGTESGLDRPHKPNAWMANMIP